jgi:serine/threonine protein kinase
LIDESEGLRLVDLGLSYDGLSGIARPPKVRTPDYIAPEIVSMRPHSFSADHWSLGVLLFEKLYGCPPFLGEDSNSTFRNIVRRRIGMNLLEDVSVECKDFIDKLLALDPNTKLGSARSEELTEHPWFHRIDWDTESI